VKCKLTIKQLPKKYPKIKEKNQKNPKIQKKKKSNHTQTVQQTNNHHPFFVNVACGKLLIKLVIL
jgi:hypothetical protein